MQLYIPVTYSVLFPRVRGNPLVDPMELTPVRFIPACTGEPRISAQQGRTDWVYPRVYGGTEAGLGVRAGLQGLSPRVRGNHIRIQAAEARLGSIPTCTGEPCIRGSRTGPVQVYPRVYGGTPSAPDDAARIVGLSPRVRGNRSRQG